MCECKILSSTAGTAVNGSDLRITPVKSLSPENEQRMKILITTDTPSTGEILPVVIFVNQTAVPVYDKYGNIVYGNQLKRGLVLKGYFGNNGSGGEDHFLVVLTNKICCCTEEINGNN